MTYMYRKTVTVYLHVRVTASLSRLENKQFPSTFFLVFLFTVFELGEEIAHWNLIVLNMVAWSVLCFVE